MAGVGDTLLRGCDLNRSLGLGSLSRTQRKQNGGCKGDPVTNLSQQSSCAARMRASQYGFLHLQVSIRWGFWGACGGYIAAETLSVSPESKLVAIILSTRQIQAIAQVVNPPHIAFTDVPLTPEQEDDSARATHSKLAQAQR